LITTTAIGIAAGFEQRLLRIPDTARDAATSAGETPRF
jgi:hypothetical protein